MIHIMPYITLYTYTLLELLIKTNVSLQSIVIFPPPFILRLLNELFEVLRSIYIHLNLFTRLAGGSTVPSQCEPGKCFKASSTQFDL